MDCTIRLSDVGLPKSLFSQHLILNILNNILIYSSRIGSAGGSSPQPIPRAWVPRRRAASEQRATAGCSLFRRSSPREGGGGGGRVAQRGWIYRWANFGIPPATVDFPAVFAVSLAFLAFRIAFQVKRIPLFQLFFCLDPTLFLFHFLQDLLLLRVGSNLLGLLSIMTLVIGTANGHTDHFRNRQRTTENGN